MERIVSGIKQLEGLKKPFPSMILEELQKRLIGAKLYETSLYNSKWQRIQRLYIKYGINSATVKTESWLEVVNDRLTVFVRVQNRKNRTSGGWHTALANKYKQEIERQFYEIINDCELERRKIPLHERLKDDIPAIHENSMLHQAEALRFMCSMKVSALFADAGVGKTKPIIDLCISRYFAGQIKKVLVFCPVSTIQNFQEQINTWCTCSALEWKIVGCESMSNSTNAMFEAFGYVDSETQVIIDESHLVKNPFSKRAKRILYCADKTSYKVIMTGTPTEHLKDLYMQYAMLSELITGCNNYYKFEGKYLILGGEHGDEVIGYKNMDYLMGLLEPYTFQIKKEEALKNIPAKRFSEICCDLNPRQQQLYDFQKDSLLRVLGRGHSIVAHTIFGYLTRMQQICCGFSKNYFTKEFEYIGTEKINQLYLTEYRDGQTIFFCKYLYEIEILIKILGIENCAVFTGQNKKWRNYEKGEFQVLKKKYFLSTMGCGGVGLNGLQGCHRIVFFSNSFKNIDRQQSIARIDRYGQKFKMDIWDMFTNAGIDAKIRTSIERKEDLANEIKELLFDRTKLKKFVEEL